MRYLIIFWRYLKKAWRNQTTNNQSIRIYVNRVRNRIKFKIKTGYYLELLTPETMKLHGSTKNKITKDEDGANVLHLGITKVVLMHYNIINNHYQQDSRVLYPFVLNKSSGHSLDISPKTFTF